VADISDLRQTLENLARTTWTDIEAGRQLSVPMGETGITDRNMLALRRQHPSLVVHKHAAYEEIRTGADWEWWLGTPAGWICLVFQAKVLSSAGRYPGITKGTSDGKLQIDILLHHCLSRSERLRGTVWPLYCFYNNWPGNWPEGIRRFDLADPRAMSKIDLQLFGCAVADAQTVRGILRHASRRTTRDSYLPVSRPWSLLFPDPADAARCQPLQTLIALSSWRYGTPMLEVRPPYEPPPGWADREPMSGDRTDGAEPDAYQRRDRQVVYRYPSLIRHPPDYVHDLLAGGPGWSRQLKPLARRVVVLPLDQPSA
jgi:hypothetical protein